MKVISPVTEEVLESYPAHTSSQVEDLLHRAGDVFRTWRRTPLDERGRLMLSAARLLRDRSAALAALMTREMGKPITAAESEVEKCAAACEHFAEHARRYLEPREITSDAARSFVRFDPLGPVLAIMPWNFPFWQVIRFAAPALMAGNVGLLKHAPNVPGCALAIERLFLDAGFPAGVFTTLLVDTPVVKMMIHHPAVQAVTLTGSERAGMSVAAEAGSALKKVVLELGGSDPFMVLPDADVEATAKAAAAARSINAGQSCIAAKRFILVGARTDFEERFAHYMAAQTIGDPANRGTEVGPLAHLDLLENLHRQVEQSIAQGALPLSITGGRRLPRKGFFYAPTVLTGVRPGMPAFDEETFGPVASVTNAASIDDAIELANNSHFGLGASIWTRDLALAERLAARIESGSVFINGPVKSDPRLPFGGIKHSGYGRELASFGICEFVNIKTVWIKAAT